MGSLTFDFLTESFLFSDELIDRAFDGIPVTELEQELERYKDFCVAQQSGLFAEVDGRNTSLTLYDAERFNITQLKQAALYVHQYVLPDPLLPFSEKRSKSATNMTAASFGSARKGETPDKQQLSRVLASMKTLTPMVANDFIKFVPTNVPQVDSGMIPILASETNFEDALPTEILKLFKEAAQVSTVSVSAEGHIRFAALKPCRRIDIHFNEDIDSHRFMYVLHQIAKALAKDGSPNELQVALTLPETPPDNGEFQTWVQQSVNQAARSLFSDTYNACSAATALNIAFSTHSELRFKALKLALEPRTSVPIRTANAFLNLDLPFVEQIDIGHLMTIRRQEGEAFANFRLALEQRISALRDVSDPHEAKRQASEAVRELTEVQLQDVRSKMRSMREKLKFNSIASIITLGAAVQLHGWGILTAAAAAIPLGNTVLDYRRDIKRHPAFFLWKVKSGKTSQT
jgi:hypothetical protein